MSKYKIRISAKGFFFNQKGEVLLIEGLRPEKGKTYYCAPGGGVEDGENLKNALERELIEETGYSGKAKKLVFCQDYKGIEERRNFEVFFTGIIDEKIEQVPGGDHKSKFISEKEFKTINFLPKGISPFELRKKEGIEYETCL